MAETARADQPDLASLTSSLGRLAETCEQQSCALAEQAARIKHLEAALADRDRMVRWQEQMIQWQDRALRERPTGSAAEVEQMRQELESITSSTAYRFGTFFSRKIAALKLLLR